MEKFYLHHCSNALTGDFICDLQDYIHRVGRTARAGRSGVAISLVNQYELEWYLQIEKLMGRSPCHTLGIVAYVI